MNRLRKKGETWRSEHEDQPHECGFQFKKLFYPRQGVDHDTVIYYKWSTGFILNLSSWLS